MTHTPGLVLAETILRPGDWVEGQIHAREDGQAPTGHVELRAFDVIDGTHVYRSPAAFAKVIPSSDVSVGHFMLEVPNDVLQQEAPVHDEPVDGSGWSLCWIVNNVTHSSQYVSIVDSEAVEV